MSERERERGEEEVEERDEGGGEERREKRLRKETNWCLGAWLLSPRVLSDTSNSDIQRPIFILYNLYLFQNKIITIF